jgi:thiol-disulfide isomerase/thioredoxin
MRKLLLAMGTLAACGEAPVVATAPVEAPSPAEPASIVAPAPVPAMSTSADGLVNGAIAPDFDLAVVGGTDRWRLYDHVAADGHGTAGAAIVAFTASWCGPCRESLPTLASLAAEHPDLAIVVLSIDDLEAERLKERKAMDDAGVSAPLLAGDEATLTAWLGTSRHIPRFIFLNHIAEVMVQDRGFGDKVRPMMPKQANYALSHPEFVQR